MGILIFYHCRNPGDFYPSADRNTNSFDGDLSDIDNKNKLG